MYTEHLLRHVAEFYRNHQREAIANEAVRIDLAYTQIGVREAAQLYDNTANEPECSATATMICETLPGMVALGNFEIIRLGVGRQAQAQFGSAAGGRRPSPAYKHNAAAVRDKTGTFAQLSRIQMSEYNIVAVLDPIQPGWIIGQMTHRNFSQQWALTEWLSDRQQGIRYGSGWEILPGTKG